MTVQHDDDLVRLNTNRTTYTISLATGDVIQTETDGRQFLGTPLRSAFFWAATDSDFGFMGLAMGRKSMNAAS